MTDTLSPEAAESIFNELGFGAFGTNTRGPTIPLAQLVTDYGPLTAAHVAIAEAHVESGQTLNVSMPEIKQLRHTHHRAAQLLAIGVDENIVAKLCNYSVSRISVLKSDPAFSQLLAYYAENVEEKWGDFVSTAAGLSMDMLQELQRRLDETPEAISTQAIIESVKLLADRTGHAPVQKSVNVNVNTDVGAKLQAAKQRIIEQQRT